jgi:CheY-like chemotaxis protein
MPWCPKVLIVDDEVMIVATLKGILEALGVKSVESAHAYDEAVRLLDRPSPFDLAFIDLKLGRTLSGVELARTAAALGIQVIAMTGYSLMPEGLEGAALLTKPFSVEAVQLVFDTMGRQRPK